MWQPAGTLRGMSLRLVVPAVVAVAILTDAPSGQAAPPAAGPSAAVRVRVALVPPVPPSGQQLRAMTQETDAIWRPYGVTLVWLTEGTGESSAGSAALLRVHFVHGARPTSRIARSSSSSLGAIQFLDGVVPDDTIMLSTDEIAATVMSTQVSGHDLPNWPPALIEAVTGRATGRVLAHELGHYLLALRTHSQKGLMRPAFAGRELVDWDRRTFSLDTVALQRLRARTAELTAAAVAPQDHGGL